MSTTRLSAQATVNLQAAAGSGKKTFNVNAYNGDAIRPYSPMLDAPLVIDLAGVNVPSENLSALLDHKPSAIVGQTTSVSIGDAINMAGIITGNIDDPNSPAGTVTTHARNGYIWPASIDGEIQRMEFIEAGEQVVVNSKTFNGPVYVARATILDGFSFVSTGADRSARAKVAARTGAHMEFHDWLQAKGFEADSLTDKQRESLQASYDAELKASSGGDPLGGTRRQKNRVAKLQAVLDDWSDRHPQHAGIIEACGKVALEEGWSSDRLELKLWQETGPQADNRLRASSSSTVNQNTLTAGLLCRAGYESLAAKEFGDQTVSAARRFSHTLDVVRAAFAIDGRTCPSDKREMIQAAVSGPSTMALPTAFTDASRRIVVQAYMQAPRIWDRIAKKVPLEDFRPTKAMRPVLRGGMREVPAGGDLKHSSAEEVLYDNIQLRTFGRILAVDRRDIINDDLGVLNELAAAMAPDAARGLNDLFAEVLLGGAASHFSSANGNEYVNAGAALSVPAVEYATKLMRLQTDADGRCLDLSPATLLVPPSLESAGKQILNSMELARYTADGTDNRPTGNPHKGSLELLVEPRLEAASFSGSSASTWFIFASPLMAPMHVGLLRGNEAPLIEWFGMQASAEWLGIQLRCVFDYGVSLGDPKAGVRMATA